MIVSGSAVIGSDDPRSVIALLRTAVAEAIQKRSLDRWGDGLSFSNCPMMQRTAGQLCVGVWGKLRGSATERSHSILHVSSQIGDRCFPSEVDLARFHICQHSNLLNYFTMIVWNINYGFETAHGKGAAFSLQVTFEVHVWYLSEQFGLRGNVEPNGCPLLKAVKIWFSAEYCRDPWMFDHHPDSKWTIACN